MPKRLLKLAATLDRLRDVLSGRMERLRQARHRQLQKRAALEAFMQSDTRFLDITLGGGLKRLTEISAAISAIDQELAKLHKRSTDAFLKAKRARATARQRRDEQANSRARLELVELAGRHAAASLRQVKTD
jgi:hypothetical protein